MDRRRTWPRTWPRLQTLVEGSERSIEWFCQSDQRIEDTAAARVYEQFGSELLLLIGMVEVSDCIREQFPLLPIEETLAIADQCGIKHPRVPGTNEPVVMTTDFLVDVGYKGSTIERARTIEPAKELSSDRVLEKFEIERRYWLRRKVDWAIVTERDIPQVLVKNIGWAYHHVDMSDRLDVSPAEVLKAERILSELLQQGIALTAATGACDDRLGLSLGTSLALARHFLATRRWVVNMDKPINPQQPITLSHYPAIISEQNGTLRQHAP